MNCPKCNAFVEDGAKFCTNCGSQINGSDANNNSSQNNNYYNQNNNYDQNKNIDYAADPTQMVNQFSGQNANYIVDGEEVLIRGKWNIVPYVLFMILGVIFLFINAKLPYSGYGLFYDFYYNRYTGLFWGTLFVYIIVCIIYTWLFLLRRELVVTNKKVYGRTGLIGIKQFVVPIKKINYVSVRYTIIGRLIHSASIFVYPGTIFGIAFRFLSNAQEVKKVLESEIYKSNI